MKFIPIPLYYARKLFFEKMKRNDGSEYWQPNELGKKYLRERTYANVIRLADRYADFMKSLNTYFEGNEYCEIVSIVSKYLSGRSWTDFAEYLVFYKGRLYDPTDEVVSKEEILMKSLDFDKSGDSPSFDLNDLTDEDEALVMQECVIDDSISARFNGFDRLFGYMDFLMDVSKRKKRQRLFDKKEYLAKKYKALGLKVHY